MRPKHGYILIIVALLSLAFATLAFAGDNSYQVQEIPPSPKNASPVISPEDSGFIYLPTVIKTHNPSLWAFSAWVYVPTNFTGDSGFILLNTYNDGGPYNWSTQVRFNGNQNLVLADGEVGGDIVTIASLPLIRGQWVQLRVEIDLVQDWQEFYYNNQLLYEGSWTTLLTGNGALTIAAVDLFGNGASAVYYDDIALIGPTHVEWTDNFDTYATNIQLHGIGGWKGWDNSLTFGAFTRSTFTISGPNSVEILGNSDLVHEFSGISP